MKLDHFLFLLKIQKSGNATNSNFQNIENILAQSRKAKFKIELISVDSDRYYDSHFLASFFLFPFINLNDFSKKNFRINFFLIQILNHFFQAISYIL